MNRSQRLFLSVSVFLTAALSLPCTGAPRRPVRSPATTRQTAASTPAYPIVDTGQNRCYDDNGTINAPAPGQPFYGQDAQYIGRPPAYTDNGDGTVTDTVTGLMWQKTPDTDGDGDVDEADKLTWDDAVARASSVTLGEHHDWRLPTIKELYSLIDFRGTDPSGYTGTDTSGLVPFIDTGYFDFVYGDTSAGVRIIDAQYWSATRYVSTTMGGDPTAFGVNFADGRIKGYPITTPDGTAHREFVRYVRGNTAYGQNDFADNGDGTITDRATGLMWARTDSGSGMDWESALAWVEAKNAANYLGHNDWRLPNAKELQSIVDYTRSPDTTGSAAIDPLFLVTPVTNEGGENDFPWYWTGTSHAGEADRSVAAVYVAFGRALGWMSPPGGGCLTLMDVHGAGAQRSDPKSGSPLFYYLGVTCDGVTAYGRGPQGDVVRVDNFVRLVRDADSTPLTGDLNGDGQVGATDLLLLADYLAENLSPGDVDLSAADLDASGRVTVLDLVGLQVWVGV